MSARFMLFKFRLMFDCWTRTGILGVQAECGCGARLDRCLWNEESREVRNLISLYDADFESSHRHNTLNHLTKDIGLSGRN